MMQTLKALTFIVLGLAIAAMGFYVAQADDAPGAAAIGLLVLIGAVVLGLKAARNRLPVWATRAALVVGIAIAAVAVALTYGVSANQPLFADAQAVPSVADTAPPHPFATAVDRARAVVRRAMVEQNVPGVSVAVGAGGTLVWAEGFGWRDVETRTPVTPTTRFHLGTAATVVQPAAASQPLAHTAVDTAADWSPEHVGEEEEDFPPLAILRHLVWQPLGLMPAEYPLMGERATFYVPRNDDHDPRRGRRLMYMRDLACCLDGKAYSSMPADLVRIALATSPAAVDGTLAGGTVMSLVTVGDRGLVVAVSSNIAYANTPAIARRIADAFAATPQ